MCENHVHCAAIHLTSAHIALFFNTLLTAGAIFLIIFGLYSLFRSTVFHKDRRKANQKTFGLIVGWAVIYLVLSIEWRFYGLYKEIPSIDNTKWALSEVFSQIILARFLFCALIRNKDGKP